MDPLSITASIAALIGLTDVAIIGVRKLVGLKKVSLVLQQVNNELADLRLLVGKVENIYRQSSDSGLETGPDQEALSVAIRRAKEIMLDLEKIIAYDLLKLSGDNKLRISRTSWLRNENRIRERRDKVRVAKQDISEAMRVDEMRRLATQQQSLVDVKVGLQSVISHQQRLDDMMKSMIQAPGRSTIQSPEIGPRLLENREQEQALCPPDLLSKIGPASSQPILIYTRGNKPCGPFCACICHQKKQFSRASIFGRVLGSLFVGYADLPFITPVCDLSCCVKRTAPTFMVSYMFPQWFLNWIIRIELRYPTPEPLLRILEMRPNDSKVFKALRLQDISEIRTMIADGQASIRDVDEEGASLISMTVTSMDTVESSFLEDLINLGADILQQDKNGMSAYLYFWYPFLICGQTRPTEQFALFGSKLVVDHFQFTGLHAAVLGLDLDGATPEEVMNRTPRESVNGVDHLGRKAVSWACVKNDLYMIEKLLKMGADPSMSDGDGRTSLHNLAFWERRPDERCLDELLENGAKPNVRNRLGGTPLHDFALNKFCTASSVEKFHCKGADLNIRVRDWWTPLHWAVRNNNIDVINTLVRCGADLEIQSKLGATPLTYALVRHQYQTFRYLLELGCDHTVRAQSGSSLLHFAARDADIDTLQYLQQRNLDGINPDDRDQDGLTALEHSERRRDGVHEWTDLIKTEVLPDVDSRLWFEALVVLDQKIRAM